MNAPETVGVKETVRRTIRYCTLSTLATAAQLTGSLPAALRRHRVHLLLFHDVHPQHEAAFRNMLESLAREHQFVSYSEAVRRVMTGDIDRSYLSVTFDDGRATCFRAARIMTDLGIRACFFVCPSIIGETNPIRVKEFSEQRLREYGVEFLNWNQAEQMRKDGHEFGGHTMTHANLASLDADQLQREVEGCFELVAERLGPATHFAWPFGRFVHFTGEAGRLIFKTGFQSCASAVRGCHIPNGSRTPQEVMLLRDNLEPYWPVSHVKYLLAQGSWTAHPGNDAWPEELKPVTRLHQAAAS